MKNCKFIVRIFFILILFSACQPSEPPQPLELPLLFSDHLVLQQQKEVAIWGTFTPNGKVTVTGSWGNNAIIKVGEDGKWITRIATPKAGGPFTLTIATVDSTIILNDVMVGEVWLASGQSNMEMPVKGWPPNDLIEGSAETIANANFPKIRLFNVMNSYSDEPVDTLLGEWQVASPQTVGNFSASAFYFARRLTNELNIPIGIIHSSWGGTPAEAWTSKEELQPLEDFNKEITFLASTKRDSVRNAWYGNLKTKPIPNTDAEWNNINFDDETLAAQNYKDADWSTIELPGRFDEIRSGAYDGVAWLRKTVMVEDVNSDYTLKLGAVDDMDATFFNGKKIGGLAGSDQYNVPREFTVPKALLQKGKNTIAIRAIDTGGPGSVSAPMTLSNKKGKTISLAGDWKNMPIAEIADKKFYVYDAATFNPDDRPNIQQVDQNFPTVLYNAMIHPLLPFTIKGAIWYQGESNVGRAAQYEKLFPAMITDWRKRWSDEFPFYFVQIAPFRYNSSGDEADDVSQKLREAQRHSLALKNTGMVVTMDIGNFTNIHPANKKDVGERLAGLALANDYGKMIVPSGPLYKSHLKSGNQILVEFDFVGGGLKAKNGRLVGFEIASADKNFKKAKAKIVDGKIAVYNNSITDPEFVRYAWLDNGVASLFNEEGLPASSFSTE